MRQIDSKEITKAVKNLCIEANYYLPKDIFNAIEKAYLKETFAISKDTLEIIMNNSKIAEEDQVPICQDTGMTCVFLEIGQDIHITGELIENAVNEGVRQGYEEGYLRKSVVSDPLERINTKDNTPAIIHYEIVKGENIKITIAPKGFGSENMSKIKMLKPSDGLEGVKAFILDTVKEAGPNPCPPIVVGIGIGGTFEKAALLSKKALLRPINVRNKNLFYSKLEEEMLAKINEMGIGPQGFGGGTTALGVNIETFPTHIAGLPVAVNISCHVTRHVVRIL
ncbi:fumarate hydratase [Clostridium pasteurianum]|uniref:Hydro-lyase, Fe-S type, tartrate/fumarate subfamily n=1 Tax=Clostridium pasteurianum BC1 TaxID=86416 RepID=R4K7L3_CLOPA|nr:fumarate hydratase [Clostridium pasteurianum]AGK99182.1 hydro-lyase, Fe-S type, tartrate/fumarate subfamily [Clostridium pasteurianum BC1]